jgi:predicted Rossmann fold nucleotide-binding protein DprA/Smf involved in DNA uptake
VQSSLSLLPVLSENEKKVYDILIEPWEKESLIQEAGLSFTDGLVTLMTLEGKGVIKEQFGEIRRVI